MSFRSLNCGHQRKVLGSEDVQRSWVFSFMNCAWSLKNLCLTQDQKDFFRFLFFKIFTQGHVYLRGGEGERGRERDRERQSHLLTASGAPHPHQVWNPQPGHVPGLAMDPKLLVPGMTLQPSRPARAVCFFNFLVLGLTSEVYNSF